MSLRFNPLIGLTEGNLAAALDRYFTRIGLASDGWDMVVFRTTKSATLQLTDGYGSTQVDSTAAATTISLPQQPVGNRRRTVTKTDASANAVTVSGNGSLINGASTYALAAQYNSVTVEPTGTGWLVVASYP